MSDASILDQMIRDNAKVTLQEEYEKHVVVLNEPKAAASSVKISGMPSDAIVINVDSFFSPETIFSGSKGECKRADYLIVSEERQCVVYIELKETKGPENEIIDQLRGAKCFMRYCQEIGKSFWLEKDFLEGYVHRFVSVTHTGSKKSQTKVDRQPGVHDAPEKLMKIHCPHYLQFNHLAGAK
jgi:hypothetical protein